MSLSLFWTTQHPSPLMTAVWINPSTEALYSDHPACWERGRANYRVGWSSNSWLLFSRTGPMSVCALPMALGRSWHTLGIRVLLFCSWAARTKFRLGLVHDVYSEIEQKIFRVRKLEELQQSQSSRSSFPDESFFGIISSFIPLWGGGGNNYLRRIDKRVGNMSYFAFEVPLCRK